MRLLSLVLVPVALFTLAACTSSHATLTPSGGTPVSTDVDATVTALASGDLRLQLSRSFGAHAGVEDSGEYVDVAVELDPSAMVPGTLAIAGTMHFDATTMYLQAGESGTFSFTPGTGHAPAIHGVEVLHGCFCDAHENDVPLSGTLTLTEVTASRVTGSIHLDLTGTPPGLFAAPSTTVDAEFSATR